MLYKINIIFNYENNEQNGFYVQNNPFPLFYFYSIVSSPRGAFPISIIFYQLFDEIEISFCGIFADFSDFGPATTPDRQFRGSAGSPPLLPGQRGDSCHSHSALSPAAQGASPHLLPCIPPGIHRHGDFRDPDAGLCGGGTGGNIP